MNPKLKLTGQTNQILCSPDLDFNKYGIYKRFYGATFKNLEEKGVPLHLRMPYLKVRKWVEEIDLHLDTGVGMILKGPVGTLKTTLAVAVLQFHLRRRIEQDLAGGGYFVPMVNLMDMIFTLKEQNKAEWLRYEEKIRTTKLLVLDDFGAEYNNPWVNSKVDAIINERYNRMLPVIITTNLSHKELAEVYNKRIYDRIKAVSQVVNFEGESLRDLNNNFEKMV